MQPKRIQSILLTLVILAVTVRIGAIVALKSWKSPSYMEHRQLALSLVKTGTFAFRDFDYYGPSSVQSPPYPFLLAGLFKIFGPDSTGAFVSAMLINSLIGGLTVWLTYRLALTLGASNAVGLTAAALAVVWPTQIYAATYVQAIVLITACLTAMMFLFYKSIDTRKAAPWIGFSLIGTLAALTEPVFLPGMALTGLLILAWRSLPWSIRVRNATILFVAAVVVIGPWSIRNRAVHGQWIPIKSTFWVNMWKGNNEWATGTDRLAMSSDQPKLLANMSDAERRSNAVDHARQYDRLTPEQNAELKNQPEAVREKIFKKYATTWISAHPARYVKLCLARFEQTLWIDYNNPKSHDLRYIIPRALLQILTVVGLALAIRRRWRLAFPALIACTCILTYTLTITAARFSIPFEPLQFCFAGLVLVSAVEIVRSKNADTPSQRAVEAH